MVARICLVLVAGALLLPAAVQAQLPGGRAIAVTTSIAPDVHLFAESVTATTRVIVDPREYDPDRIDVRVRFAPYELLRSLERSRREVGDLVELRYTATLRCLDLACLAPRFQTVLGDQEGGRAERFTFRFAPAEVLYRQGDGSVELVVQRPFPALEVVSRINTAQVAAVDQLGLEAAPTSEYTASLAPPPPTYRIAPRALAAGALVLAAVLLLFPVSLAVSFVRARWRARRRPRQLSPGERALLLVEWAGRQADGEQDRRRALEALADVLERSGAEPLAESTRTFAWAQDAPDRGRAAELAGEARSVLGGGDGRAS